MKMQSTRFAFAIALLIYARSSHAANMPPQISSVSDSTQSWNASPTLIAPSANISDCDSPDFNGGTLQIRLTSGATTNDRLNIRLEGTGVGKVNMSGTIVKIGSVAVGRWNGTEILGSTVLTVTFNQNAPPSVAQAILRNIVYRNTSTSAQPGDRIIGIRVSDGDGGTSTEFKKTLRLTNGIGTLLVRETFEDNSVDGFDEVYSSATSSIVLDERNNRVFQTTFSRDETSGNLLKYNLNASSVHVSFRERLPDGIPISQGQGFAGLKQSRLFRTSGSPSLRNIQHELKYVRPFFDGTGARGAWSDGFYVEYQNRSFNHPITLSPQTWWKTSYYVRFNTPGKSDGVLQYFRNDQMILNLDDVNISPSISERPDGLMIGGNFSHGGIAPDRPFRRWLDDIEIRIGGDPPVQLTP